MDVSTLSGLYLSRERFADSCYRGIDVLAAVKRAQPEVTFATRSKTAARRSDDVTFIEQLVKELPAGFAFGGFDPNIRSMLATKYGHPTIGQLLTKDLGIRHVEFDQAVDLLTALFRVSRRSRFLNRIGNAIELCTVATVPERMNFNGVAS